MGNCMNILDSAPKNKVKVLVFGGGEEEFKASTTVRKIISGSYRGYKLVNRRQPKLPLPPEAKLSSSQYYFLIPQKTARNSGKVKIVLTKQQVELLVSNATEFQSHKVVLQPESEREGCQKWRPSLATIPEL